MSIDATRIVVTGLLSADDALQALKALGKWRPLRAGLLFVVFLLVITAIVTAHKPGLRIPVLLVVGVNGSLIAIGSSSGQRAKFAKQFYANPQVMNPIVWTFSSEGLLIQTVNSSSAQAWNSFEKVTITPTLVILEQPGGSLFNVIPRRLFATESDYLAACQLISANLTVRRLG